VDAGGAQRALGKSCSLNVDERVTAYGQVAWSWHPDADAPRRRAQARRRARWPESPAHRGEREATV